MDDLIGKIICSLKKGELIVVIDDMNRKMGFIMGIAEKVSPQNINIMTKIGKGLTYVCITEDKAKNLSFPRMVNDTKYEDRDFAVSVIMILQQLVYLLLKDAQLSNRL